MEAKNMNFLRVNALVVKAAGPEVDDLDRRPVGRLQQDVLRLQVAVDQPVPVEQLQALEHRVGELANQLKTGKLIFVGIFFYIFDRIPKKNFGKCGKR